ncbi:MAG: TIGR03557 family F420-dependent LLM class oxidoreductase [Acidimicrobiia bacterium]
MASNNLLLGAGLSCEEQGPNTLLSSARAAMANDFQDFAVTDHYHPWVRAQGHSPFVWSALAALSQLGEISLGTAVTCPTVRIHPAIIAQAAATTSLLTNGRFWLGVGTGENLNEHILGHRWPPARERLAMLKEAIEILRLLWGGGEQSYEGKYYVVEDAELYDLPDNPPKIFMSAFGPQAAIAAAEMADGLVLTGADSGTISTFRENGGQGEVHVLMKFCWDEDEKRARQICHKLWPTSGVPGQLSQDLRTPALFEQAISIVTEEDAVGNTPVGPDPERYVTQLRELAEAGATRIFVQQVGPNQERGFKFIRDEVLPRL